MTIKELAVSNIEECRKLGFTLHSLALRLGYTDSSMKHIARGEASEAKAEQTIEYTNRLLEAYKKI